MPGGKGRGREQKMIFHFDQVLRDYKGSFQLVGRSEEKWQLLGDLSLEKQLLFYTLAFVFVVWFFVVVIIDWASWVVTLFAAFIVFSHVVALLSFKNKEEGRRAGPGVYKKYHVSMADTVDRIYQALDAWEEEFDVFGITLTDWPERPRATVFAVGTDGILITVWKDVNDPYFTLVHTGPYTLSRGDRIDGLKVHLDAHVPDRT